MENTQLFDLLKTLSPKEIREVRKFLKSPFFNQRKDVLILFDFLISKIQKNKLIVSKEKVFFKIYPKKKYDQQMLRQVMSWVQKLVEKYLAYQIMHKDEIEVKIRLANSFRTRELEKHYQKTIKEAQVEIGEVSYRNTKYYENQYQLEFEKFLSGGTKRMGNKNFAALFGHLDTAYITKKLHHASLAVAHQAVFQSDVEIGFLKEILKYIEDNDLKKNPTIAMYWYCYFTLTNPEDEIYFKGFKNLLLTQMDLLPASDLRDLYLAAINFCIRRLNAGQKHYVKEGLNLYKSALSSKILFLNGVLSRFTFQNIVALGLNEGDTDWVENFIQEFSPYLTKEYMESATSLNLARVEYQRKNFNQVLDLLQRADYTDLLMNLSAKTLAAKTYFELDEIILLDSHLHTMQIFIKRKKVMGYHKKNYLNFVQFLQKMIKIPQFKSEKIKALKLKIESEEILTEKRWFLEMLDS